MDRITLDKTITFPNQIDKLLDFSVKDNLSYLKNNDSMQAKGVLLIKGKVLLLTGEKEFYESIDVDIYAPFVNNINLNDFKINIEDYTYLINNNKLLVYVYLSFSGINEETDSNQDNIADALNNVNQIEKVLEDRKDDDIEIINDKDMKNEILENEDEEETEKSNNKNDIETSINIKDNKKEDLIDSNWVDNLFNVGNEYSSFPYK